MISTCTWLTALMEKYWFSLISSSILMKKGDDYSMCDSYICVVIWSWWRSACNQNIGFSFLPYLKKQNKISQKCRLESWITYSAVCNMAFKSERCSFTLKPFFTQSRHSDIFSQPHRSDIFTWSHRIFFTLL